MMGFVRFPTPSSPRPNQSSSGGRPLSRIARLSFSAADGQEREVVQSSLTKPSTGDLGDIAIVPAPHTNMESGLARPS
ncbi:hypothetical protein GQ53DRAFT_749056 [Thozetella sp. PMI_491]|nr:hypothetical protein GQ53DRAFT_749056 [Thozetella sp. PMI_491]